MILGFCIGLITYHSLAVLERKLHQHRMRKYVDAQIAMFEKAVSAELPAPSSNKSGGN